MRELDEGEGVCVGGIFGGLWALEVFEGFWIFGVLNVRTFGQGPS